MTVYAYNSSFKPRKLSYTQVKVVFGVFSAILVIKNLKFKKIFSKIFFSFFKSFFFKNSFPVNLFYYDSQILLPYNFSFYHNMQQIFLSQHAERTTPI